MAQAMSAIKREMGKDVEIVAQRTVRRGGFFGIGSRTEVEVIARVMPRRPGTGKRRSRSSGASASSPDDFAGEAMKVVQVAKGRLAARGQGAAWVADAPIVPTYGAQPLVRDLSAGTYGPGGRRPRASEGAFAWETSPLASPGAKRPAAAGPAGSAPELQGLRDELAELKDLIINQNLARNGSAGSDFEIEAEPERVSPAATGRRVSQGAEFGSDLLGGERISRHAEPGREPMTAVVAEDPISVGLFRRMHDRLTAQGVSEPIARGILERVAKRTTGEEAHDRAVVESRIAKEITAMVRIAPAIEPHPDLPRVIVAVGPTGVGKTTTLAKLGGIFYEEEQFSVAYLTLDNYRVAAAEQLRSYSDIIGVTFEQVASAAELREAVERNMDKEFILVDTAGRSPYAREAIDELRETLSGLSIDPHLLLHVSAATAPDEMETVIRNFRISERVQLVFTKLDETQRWGGVFAAAVRSGLPVSYCTTGQNVPTDIEPALASRFAEELLASGSERQERGAGASASGGDRTPRFSGGGRDAR
jgi:flagellar biosynthesis protein FlhF